jgi:hypothetical protein
MVLPAEASNVGSGQPGLFSPSSTFFVEMDLFVLQPSIKGTLYGTQPQADGSLYTYNTPGVSLGTTAAPRFDIGRRFADDWGAFVFSYRFISATGTGGSADAYGPLTAQSRLDMNVFDLDYVSAPLSPCSRFFVQYRLGVRLEEVDFRNQVTDGQGFFETADSRFFGAGPHAALTVGREIAAIRGLSLFATADAALAFGRVRQHFSELYNDGSFYPFSQCGSQMSPNFTAQAGVSYTPSCMPYLRLLAGFQCERFWNVGKTGGSEADVQDIGGFVGGVLNF